MELVKICKEPSLKDVPQKYSSFANVEVLLGNSSLI